MNLFGGYEEEEVCLSLDYIIFSIISQENHIAIHCFTGITPDQQFNRD